MPEIVCRICLIPKEEGSTEWTSIFEKISKKTVLQIMMECANIKVLESDCLPKSLCYKCLERIKLIDTFRNLIIASDLVLKEKYSNNKIDKTKEHILNLESELDSTPIKTQGKSSLEMDNYEEENFFEPYNIKTENCAMEINCVQINNNSIKLSKSFKKYNENIKQKNIRKPVCKKGSGIIKAKLGKSPTLHKIAINFKKSKLIKGANTNNKKSKQRGKANIKSKIKSEDNERGSRPNKRNVKTENKNEFIDHTNDKEIIDNLDHIKDERFDYPTKYSGCDKIDSQPKKKPKTNNAVDRSHMGKIKCPRCNHISVNKYVLRQHIRIKHEMENDKKPYCCDQCPKRYINNYQLKVHRNTHTGAKPYPCDMCDRKFKSPTAARLHKQLQHIIDKKWKCFDCQKGFISQHMLQNHVRQVHTKERPFLCEICSKGFSAKGMLTTHIKSVHVKETEPCPVCKKEYNVFSMKVHLQSHQGLKNHVCETCGNAFTTKGSLKAHKYIHTGEKPNICQICGKGFIQKQSLKKHIMSHSDLRPFLCTVCNETYKYRQDLLRHMKKHQKEQEK